jgi:hypothetical protein
MQPLFDHFVRLGLHARITGRSTTLAPIDKSIITLFTRGSANIGLLGLFDFRHFANTYRDWNMFELHMGG